MIIYTYKIKGVFPRMKIRVISTKEEIDDLPANELVVHCAFRPGNKEIFRIIDMCPKLEAIQVPKSYMATIATSVKRLLALKRIELIEGDVQGHRKDIDKYYSVPEKVIERIKEMKVSGKKDAEILEEINKTYVLRPETAAYVIQSLKV
jgi:hypothetical protein